MNGEAKTSPVREERVGARVPLEGDLGLRDAVEVCARLRDAVAAFDPVEIDVSGLTGLDISIVQLLLAARKTAQRQSKVLFVSGEWAPSCRDALVEAGLLAPEGAAHMPDADFWLGRTPSQLQAV